MSEKPIIALTVCGCPFDPGRRDVATAAHEWITNAYGAGIVRAGGVPLLLSNECPPEEIGRLLGKVDALFLTGGEDVAPEHFGESVAVDNLTVNTLRDKVDLAAIAAADQRQMPILGVCRGIQVLNIARGGTIFQDLPVQYGRPLRDHSRGGSRVIVQTHDIALEEDSHLARLLRKTRITVATSHHQAIRELGRDLMVAGRCPEDDVIEAVEEKGGRFVVAVQWHPEVRPDDSETTRLLEEFVIAARAYAAQTHRAIR